MQEAAVRTSAEIEQTEQHAESEPPGSDDPTERTHTRKRPGSTSGPTRTGRDGQGRRDNNRTDRSAATTRTARTGTSTKGTRVVRAAQQGAGSAGSRGRTTRRGSGASSGSLPMLVLLAIVTAVSGIVMLLYAEGNEPDPSSREPRQATEPTPDVPECPIPTTHSPRVIDIVYQVGTERGANQTVMLAAFEAGWVESRMRNLDCGDRDSLGVFQQRPSQGWGDPDEVQDVRYAATQFFEVAEKEYEKAPDETAGNLAQRVQRSAFPERYDEAESKALELLNEARARAGDGSPSTGR